MLVVMEGGGAMGLQLYKFEIDLPEDVNLALVICGEDSAEGQRHTGFVVRNMQGEMFLFHLARNNDFRKSVVQNHYNYLLIPALEPEIEMPIIAFLFYLYADCGGRLPYSIVYKNGEYFSDAGELLMLEVSDGFTCATFVLETLKKYAMDLVDRNTWPIGASDIAWQEGIVKNIGLGLTPEQFFAQVKSIGKYPRFRPEQALGAAHYYSGHKLPFSVVEPAGVEVVGEMARLRA